MCICLDACKKGFLAGCRLVITVDGCHLKVGHGGQLLAVVDGDRNNDLFSIAYAVVDSKCKD